MTLNDSLLDLSVDDFTLLSGAVPSRALERAMLVTLADRDETLREFIDRLGADELDYGLVSVYAAEGAFADPSFYVALTHLRRAHPESASLVRTTRTAFMNRYGTGPYPVAGSGENSERDMNRLRASFDRYSSTLSPKARERLFDLAEQQRKQHL